MPAWLAFSILTVVFWSCWGLQSKLAVEQVSPWMNQVLFPLGLMPPVLWLMASGKAPSSTRWKSGGFFSFLTGILGGAGNVTFYLAIQQGRSLTVVVVLTSLFPLVTVLLARLVLKESISRAQMCGLVLSVTAIVLLGL